MDRKYHKTDTFYNTDKVKDIIGLKGKSFIFDKVDVFVERVNKKNGFIIVTYKDYEDGKEVEKQYVPYLENEKDIKDFLNTCFAKKTNIHLVDYANIYFYVHADKKEKGYMDMNYVEYKDGSPKRNIMRVSRTNEYALSNIIVDYQKEHEGEKRPFDGYYRDPSDMPKRMTRKEIKKLREATRMPMPEPKVKLSIIADIEYLADCVRNYIIERFGPKKVETELHYRSR